MNPQPQSSDQRVFTCGMLLHVLRCVPAPPAQRASSLAAFWEDKRQLLDLQLQEIPSLSRAFVSRWKGRHEANPRIILSDRLPALRLIVAAEFVANTVYALGELTAGIAHAAAKDVFPASFNKLHKRVSKGDLPGRWWSEEDIRAYRMAREVRVEWTHHSASMAVDGGGAVNLVCHGYRGREDQVELVGHTLCSVENLVLWARGSICAFESFLSCLLERHILQHYDLDQETVSPVLGPDGWPLAGEGGGIRTERHTVREYFRRGGVPV